MKTRTRHVLTVVLVFAANYGLDRATKLLATVFLQSRKGISLLLGTVVLLYTENSGAFLSTNPSQT